MLRLLNFSFNGDMHWFFLLQTAKSAIHQFCLPMPFRFRKHKGHDLAYRLWRKYYDRLGRGYQELWQVHFCRTMFVDIADTTVPNLIYVLKNRMLTS